MAVSDRAELHSRSRELFRTLAEEDESGSHQVAREALIELHLPLAHHCARRFVDRREPYDDLVQVATIGLINAIDRFEPERGLEFSTFATPTIIGEIKRHFRDKGWTIRVPRRLQELRLRANSTRSDLTQKLGRAPTPRELAEEIGCSVEELMEALEASGAYAPASLDADDSGEDGTLSVLDTLGSEDENLALIDVRESLKPLLEGLEPREKRILLLRFFKNMTQSQIADELGISQMHVSRLLNRTLATLRGGLTEE